MTEDEIEKLLRNLDLFARHAQNDIMRDESDKAATLIRQLRAELAKWEVEEKQAMMKRGYDATFGRGAYNRDRAAAFKAATLKQETK